MRFYTAILGLLLLGGCSQAVTPDPFPVPPWEPGLKAFPSPRNGDGPGTVFMIDPQGVAFPVGSLALPQEPETFDVVLPTLEWRDSSDANVFLTFLRQAAGDPTLGAARSRAIAMSFSATGSRRERTNLLSVQEALPPILPLLDFSRGNYFVVVETVSADSISFKMTRDALDTLGISAIPLEQTQGRLRITRDSDLDWTVNVRLNPRMRVFYKVLRITPARAGITGTPTRMSDIVVDEDSSFRPLIRS